MTLSLHTWNPSDKPALTALCNAVDRTFLSDRLPYPYTEADADWWLGMVAENDGKEGVWRSTCLEELEQCGFIRKYAAIGKEKKDALFQLIDNYTLFYYKFIKESGGAPAFWSHSLNSGVHRAWSGLAFERVCLQHVGQIKAALGIAGVMTKQCAWRSDQKNLGPGERGTQIDLLIDRRDDTISICEMKWASEP